MPSKIEVDKIIREILKITLNVTEGQNGTPRLDNATNQILHAIYQAIEEGLSNTKLVSLLMYGFPRAVGHTYSEINGVKNNPKAILIVANEAHKEHIKKDFGLPKEKMVSLSQIPEALIGKCCPIVIDHFALELLVSDTKQALAEMFGRENTIGGKFIASSTGISNTTKYNPTPTKGEGKNAKQD